ncbi:hypothetical protein CRG98_036506 [Punica granatum]|uniref:Uncharacterized protein n=1 Tax=Punica granatum TaxID=22663 RepID=A0A2I0IGJ0_PUNGR|nr:hypothetical protein CRG98_036506 [Punica granatum]
MGLGATRDAELIQRIGAATALEARAGGINYAFAPCVAVVKDLRWNRCYESYSEDPEIVGRMASIITGLQGLPPAEHPKGHPFVTGRNNMIACAKHFVGDGGTEGGKNEGNTRTSYDELETVHMAPYLDCISQHVCTVMASYSSYNGHNMHSHKLLLTDVLKNKLGFKGFVISDWGGIDRLKDNGDPEGAEYRVCAALGINAGIDMVLGPLDLVKFQEDLISLVEAGEVPISRIDDALHREIAREAVRKSLVLLKNGKDPEKPLLPLDKNARKILVAGSHADDLGYQCGAWTVSWTGGSGRTTIGTTILDAIKRTVGPETEVIFEQCPSADTLSAHDFAFAVVAVGEPPYAEYICSKTKLVIPSDLADMICSVADRVPTLLVLITGRPIELKPEMLEKIDALVAAWLPGTEGNGITDVAQLNNSWTEMTNALGIIPIAKQKPTMSAHVLGLQELPQLLLDRRPFTSII